MMEIGSKIKKSRIEAKFTQEQVAESLGVSRQTISNWENEKSYPDIISVLKMSDLFHVSLDYLLKGENSMSGYIDYLNDSTNVVKSKTKLERTILIGSYLVVWVVAIIAFWLFTSPDNGVGYALMYLWVILPVTTFVVSLLIGKNDFWGKAKWFSSVVFGVMYMLSGYATFSMANNISFHKINIPEFSMIPAGMVISLLGLGIGHLFHTIDKKKRMQE